MSHRQQRQFCKNVRSAFPQFFRRVNVVDVGSLNINGCNKGLFSRSFYIGIDLAPGKNVDKVGPAHLVLPSLWPDPILGESGKSYAWSDKNKRIEGRFDTIISTECLEHDQYYKETLTQMFMKLRAGGLMLITAGGDGRPEHGTFAHHAACSPFTRGYYKNISNEMFCEVLGPELFDVYHLAQDKRNCDLQFYGIKKGPL